MKGYDCWFLDYRGSIYSKGHINPDISVDDYWNMVGWQEIGRYDVPAAYKAIANVKWGDSEYASITGPNNEDRRIVYVGESMGTAVGWVALNENKMVSRMDA